MANIKQQKKRNLQNEKQRVRNSQVKSSIRTAAKKVNKITELKDTQDVVVIQETYRLFVKTIDTAASKGIVKKRTADRKKSRLAKKVNSAAAALK
jgi:small subunit ribosomal protein S20